MMKSVDLSLPVMLLTVALAGHAQEGSIQTQALVNVEAKAHGPVTASALTVAVNGRKEPLSGWAPVLPANAQVAILIDDGLRESVGRELSNMKAFVQSLPPGVEVLIGYMQNGRVVADEPFSADHALAASKLHLPEGIPGVSASPYFCLSDFVKKWPTEQGVERDPNAAPTIARDVAPAAVHKARFVMMITNGVDPYNGSTSVMNQDSPYVQTTVTDAQRAGVAVYSIYYGDAGIRGGSANLSGQSYLQQLSAGTGGVAYYEGTGNPVSMAPFLSAFRQAIAGTYIATFDAPTGKDPARELVRLKLTADIKVKLHAPEDVRPGNLE